MGFCWKRVFVMTSAFSWQNSISLCPASFRIPRPNLPVTPWQKLAGSERLQPDVHLHVSSKKVWDGAFSIRRESFSPLKGEGLLPLIRYLAASFSLINY